LEEVYLTVEEVARLLRVHPNTVYRWCREGQLEAIQFGKRWRIPRNALKKLNSPEQRVDRAKSPEELWPPSSLIRHWCSAGDHVLALTESREAVYAIEAAFLRAGLSLNVRLFKGCWWQHPAEVRRELAERGLDVEHLEVQGKLIIADLQSTCDRSGPEGAASVWVDETHRARRDGYERLWGCGSPFLAESFEMHERLRSFETLLSYRLNGLPVIGLCSYVLDAGVTDYLAKLSQLIRNHWGLLTYASPENIAFARLLLN
jgi:excisionase family DNA binding protein